MPPENQQPEIDNIDQPDSPSLTNEPRTTIVVNGVTQTMSLSPAAAELQENQRVVDLVPGIRLYAYSLVAIPLACFLFLAILIAVQPMAAWLLIGAIPAIFGLLVSIAVCIYMLRSTNTTAVETILLVFMVFHILGSLGPGIIISGPLGYWSYYLWRKVSRLTKS